MICPGSARGHHWVKKTGALGLDLGSKPVATMVKWSILFKQLYLYEQILDDKDNYNVNKHLTCFQTLSLGLSL